MMNGQLLLFMVLLPAVLGGLALCIRKGAEVIKAALLLLGAAGNLVLNILAFGENAVYSVKWFAGIDFALRYDHFSSFILMCAAALTVLISIYSVWFSKGKGYNTTLLYGGMLLTLAMANGAVMAKNLLVMLFFWEAILATMFMMISAGGKDSYKTAVKAVVIAGVTDLCMMLGIGLVAHIAGTVDMDAIHLPLESWAIPAFLLLVVGAVSKAGSMPFHTWIPDAANDAPQPFMAFLPGALEKLLGIYLLARITLDLFEFSPGSAMSYTLMILGVVTIICAVMMALIQRDYKRLLSYHAVSQVGYMILGVGTALPVGIIGGLFHMLNNALYKCGLFLTAGSVEKQTGTTDLNRLGGLGKKMPVTFICFIVFAAAIAGFPMTNGFFSKELIFDGALESGLVFYIIAAVGAFFTPVSFLKLGHAVFLGKPTKDTEKAKESHTSMLIPMVLLAIACLAAGFGQSFVVERILTPILGHSSEHVGGHTNWLLVGISAGLLVLALLDHIRGFKKTGKGLEAADHFHYAPGLHSIYSVAEKHWFDPYYIAGFVINGFSVAMLKVNDAISKFYDVYIVRFVGALSLLIRKSHNGSPSRYVVWVLAGVAIVTAIFMLA